MGKPKILITGAAGYIGSILTHRLTGYYNLVLTDIRQPKNLFNHSFIKADITDLDTIRDVCQNIDMVLHLAGDPDPMAPWESLLPRNIVGVYNIFQAAHEAGCQRVIFASSVNAVLGYPRDVQVHTNMPVRPPNLYGACKVWGEAIARFYADQKGLSCICLRLGSVLRREHEAIRLDKPIIDRILTLEDLTKLVVASIEAPNDLRFGIFHGTSDNRWKRFDISDARTVLGYRPEDDAFVLAKFNARMRWYFFLKRVLRRLKRSLVWLGIWRQV